MTIPTNNSAFRVEERKYKQRSTALDLSEAIDTFGNLNSEDRLKYHKKLEFNDDSNFFCSTHVFESINFPGLFLLPRALSPETQWNLARNALFRWTRRTNLDTHYDLDEKDDNSDYSPLAQLWIKQISQSDFREICRKDLDTANEPPCSAADLVLKLRWGLLGLEYDWTKKVYTDILDANIPEFVHCLCNNVLSHLKNEAKYHVPFEPEVGIINFYREKDTLTAHVDRSEKNMSAPLISFNIGRSCVFLIGSESTDTKPDAILLHSGDILIMSGESRKAFHGVPRLLKENCMPFLNNPPGDGIEFTLTREYIKNARINVNFRQVL